jgi:hypothetical protein
MKAIKDTLNGLILQVSVQVEIRDPLEN